MAASPINAKGKQAETGGGLEPSWTSVRIPLEHIRVNPDRLSFLANEGLCGQGGFGDVHHAVLHTTSQKRASSSNPCCSGEHADCPDVAVKKLRLTSGLEKDQIEKRLSREVFVMSKLQHKNIVKLVGYHLSKEESEAWLISNWVSGGNAKEYLAAMDAKTEGNHLIDKLRLMADACDGLLYLHSGEKVVCHGDLKAANLLVEQPDGRGQLCDFGLSSFDDPTFRLLITRSQPQGTTAWCSPSVLLGGKLRPPDDIWSFGSLAYEIITGKTPFTHTGSHQGKVVLNIVFRQFPPNISGLPGPFGPLILGCWKDSAEGQTKLEAISSLIQKAILRMEADHLHPQNLRSGSCSGADAESPVPYLQDSCRTSPPVPANQTSSLSTRWAPDYLSFSNQPPRKPGSSDAEDPLVSSIDDQPCFQLLNAFRGCLCICGLSRNGRRIPRHERQDSDDASDPTSSPPAIVTPETVPKDPHHHIADVEISVRDLKTVVGPQRSFYGRSNGLLRAKLESSGEDVSVKVLSDVKDALSIVGDPLCLGRHSIVEKLHAYIRLLINLRHPRINPVLGYILVDGIPSLVTPWCANGNIEAYLQCNAAIDKWTVIDQVAEGLESLHSCNPPVVHSSLKPENVLVDHFGSIRLAEVGNIELLEHLTSGITTCGKLSDIRWLPRIQEGWTMESDIYCFGLLVFAIITGKLPYDGFSDIEIAGMKLREGSSPADGSNLPVDSPLRKLLSRCWDADSTKRPSITELRAELRSLTHLVSWEAPNILKPFSTYRAEDPRKAAPNWSASPSGPTTNKPRLSLPPGRSFRTTVASIFNTPNPKGLDSTTEDLALPATGDAWQRLQNYCIKEKISCLRTSEIVDGAFLEPTWTCTITVGGALYSGSGTRKAVAYDNASRKALMDQGLLISDEAYARGAFTLLHNFCQRRAPKIECTVTSEVGSGSGEQPPWIVTIKVDETYYTGNPKLTMLQAKDSAARKALRALNHLDTPDSPS